LNQLRWSLNRARLLWTIGSVTFILGCSFLRAAASPTPDLFATLQASTPSSLVSPAITQPTASPDFNSPTSVSPASTRSSAQTAVPPPSPADQLAGHIVFTCQVFKVQASNQVCIMNADGTGWRRLTTDNSRQHWYASLSPDGQRVFYSSFREANVHEIYEMNPIDGQVTRLTDRLGVLTAAQLSPDGTRITFARGNPGTNQVQIWVMDRNGDNSKNLPQIFGWDPTWSPDGKRILFASARDGAIQLFTVDSNGRGLERVTDLPAIRGRSDWSPDGQSIVTYSGPAWNREIYMMNADGSNVRQLTPAGGNSQGPSFSPDGKWVAFTAYFDKYGDDHGCEIYIIRVDGTDLRRLTDNDYCDYQPRWGL
jgi:TolB protein